jgi:hypothetical protein
MTGWIMSWKGYGRKRSWPNLKYYLCIFRDRIGKTTKNLTKIILSPGFSAQDTGPPRYEGRLPTIWSLRSVRRFLVYLTMFSQLHRLYTSHRMRGWQSVVNTAMLSFSYFYILIKRFWNKLNIRTCYGTIIAADLRLLSWTPRKKYFL